MRVQDVMTSGVETISPTKSSEDAWNLMRQEHIHHLVVMEGRRVVGVLSARDCGGRAGAAIRQSRTVADLMTSPALTVSPETTVQRAANMMRGQSIGCLVVTVSNRALGIVTVSDLLELVGRGTASRTTSGSRPRPTLHHRAPHRKRHRSTGAW